MRFFLLPFTAGAGFVLVPPPREAAAQQYTSDFNAPGGGQAAAGAAQHQVVDEVESLVCVPLRLEERIFGAICVYGEQGQRLSAEIISTLSSLGDVVSLAIAHAFVYQDLLSLSQTKTKFMLTASHELRSPADAIRSIAATLREGYCGELNDRQRNLVDRIEQRARAAGLARLFVLTTRTAHWFLKRGFAMADIDRLPVERQQLYNWQRRSQILLKSL